MKVKNCSPQAAGTPVPSAFNSSKFDDLYLRLMIPRARIIDVRDHPFYSYVMRLLLTGNTQSAPHGQRIMEAHHVHTLFYRLLAGHYSRFDFFPTKKIRVIIFDHYLWQIHRYGVSGTTEKIIP